MATTLIEPSQTVVQNRTKPIHQLVLTWLLLPTFVFFSARGNFSFRFVTGDPLSKNALKGLSRNDSFLGSTLIPGVCLGIVVVIVLINIKRIMPAALRMRALSALALLTIVSAAWSQDPSASILNGCFYVLNTLFAFYLVMRFDSEELMSLYTMACGAVCMLCIFTAIAYPSFGVAHYARDAGAWQGIFMDRNTLARNMVFLISPQLVFRRGRLTIFRVLFLAVVLGSIAMAHSATALVVVFLFVCVMGLLYQTNVLSPRESRVLFSVVVPLLTVAVLFRDAILTPVLGALGRDTSLTGRTEIWAAVIRSILKRPLFGYGFYAFWQGMHGESANTVMSTHWIFGYAHNGFLEILLQVGFFGFAIFLVTLFQAIRNIILLLKAPRSTGVDWQIGIIFLTLFYNIDEGTLLFPNYLLSIMYISACFGLARSAQAVREQNALALAETLVRTKALHAKPRTSAPGSLGRLQNTAPRLP